MEHGHYVWQLGTAFQLLPQVLPAWTAEEKNERKKMTIKGLKLIVQLFLSTLFTVQNKTDQFWTIIFWMESKACIRISVLVWLTSSITSVLAPKFSIILQYMKRGKKRSTELQTCTDSYQQPLHMYHVKHWTGVVACRHGSVGHIVVQHKACPPQTYLFPLG